MGFYPSDTSVPLSLCRSGRSQEPNTSLATCSVLRSSETWPVRLHHCDLNSTPLNNITSSLVSVGVYAASALLLAVAFNSMSFAAIQIDNNQ